MHNGLIDLYFKKAERKHVEAFQEAATLACPHDVDCLERFGNANAQFRRYVPQFLDTFEFRASPACTDLLRAIGLLREPNRTEARRVPDDAPISFIGRRWQPYVFAAEGINRRFYELCVLTGMSNALRSGDLRTADS